MQFCSATRQLVAVRPSESCPCPLQPKRSILVMQRGTRKLCIAATGVGAGTPEDPNRIPDVSLTSSPETAPGQPELESSSSTAQGTSPWAKVKRFFGGDKLDRKRLKALGVGALLSYGFVSNVTYGGGMAVAWVAFVKQRGLSPLMSGQWKAFLAFYAGFWTLQNFIRPFRFALAVSMAPIFDKIINGIQRSLGGTRQKAFAVSVALLGLVTTALVFGSIYIFAEVAHGSNIRYFVLGIHCVVVGMNTSKT